MTSLISINRMPLGVLQSTEKRTLLDNFSVPLPKPERKLQGFSMYSKVNIAAKTSVKSDLSAPVPLLLKNFTLSELEFGKQNSNKNQEKRYKEKKTSSLLKKPIQKAKFIAKETKSELRVKSLNKSKLNENVLKNKYIDKELRDFMAFAEILYIPASHPSLSRASSIETQATSGKSSASADDHSNSSKLKLDGSVQKVEVSCAQQFVNSEERNVLCLNSFSTGNSSIKVAGYKINFSKDSFNYSLPSKKCFTAIM